MVQLVTGLILNEKSKVGQLEGYNTLIFVDGKFKQIVEKPVNCVKGTKVVCVSSLGHNLLWGTREKLCFEKNDVFFHIGLSGKIDIQINQPRKFYNEIILNYGNIDLQQLQKIIVPVVVDCLDNYMHKFISENSLNILHIETYKSELARNVRLEISKKLEYSFGIVCKNFTILNVLFDDEELEQLKVILQSYIDTL